MEPGTLPAPNDRGDGAGTQARPGARTPPALLLRRLARHLRQQNWTAVALEFLIVAAGVLMGIQLSNWNDDRLARARQAEVLDRLASELDFTIARADERIAYNRDIITNIGVVMDAVRTGTIADSEEAQFSAGLDQLDGWWQPGWHLGTMDELISNGELKLIPDPRLRSDLIAFRDLVPVVRDDTMMLVELIGNDLPLVQQYVDYVPTGVGLDPQSEAELVEGAFVRAEADLPAMRADPRVLRALSNILRSQTYALGQQTAVRSEAAELREELQAIR